MLIHTVLWSWHTIKWDWVLLKSPLLFYCWYIYIINIFNIIPLKVSLTLWVPLVTDCITQWRTRGESDIPHPLKKSGIATDIYISTVKKEVRCQIPPEKNSACAIGITYNMIYPLKLELKLNDKVNFIVF